MRINRATGHKIQATRAMFYASEEGEFIKRGRCVFTAVDLIHIKRGDFAEVQSEIPGKHLKLQTWTEGKK